MSQDWCEAMVAELVELRRAGYLDFQEAWSVAVGKHRPRGRDAAASMDGRLFDETGERGETLVDATKRFCSDAWHGERPKLREYTLAMLRESEGYTTEDRAGLDRLAA